MNPLNVEVMQYVKREIIQLDEFQDLESELQITVLSLLDKVVELYLTHSTRRLPEGKIQ
jgi:hypothetical protein